ncbi:E2 ligase fold family C protein [Ensifer sp. ENS07]|uniref:E2 ligase fold family C protein n=1 Tax=unclassified Ensifer TaxID=2633371 RepID=UPI00177B61C7|nr:MULTISPECIES: E2 ligase fold family C protein [unclassified Ensifer]MBD9507924.1 E2 ligase fold family C protein [Ensifer sp. ENS10]MBD9637579.1 E2 ligase fold family C protein [Ensifer sp. ENS07]
MALANYFSRAATAASQVLQGFDAKHFEGLLNGLVIGIAFDQQACSTEGRASLDLLIRLLARLYPTICFLPTGDEARELAKSLGSLARCINKNISIARRRATVLSHCLVVGSTTPDVSCPTFFLGSDGWLAMFSAERPVGTGGSSNTLGAGGAACIAAANLFRHIFSAQINGAAVDKDVIFSLFDYAPGSRANPPLADTVTLDDLFLLGLGAIGNGAVWALSRVPNLRGRLEVVDAEPVDQGNLQRYVLALEKDISRSKVKLALRYLNSQTDLVVTGHNVRWQTIPAIRSMEHVAIALDTAADRVAVQGALPRWTINSWTQRGDLGVSHHGFQGEMACLACLYLPNGAVPDEDQVIAEALGLEDRKMDIVRPMLHNGAPVTAELMGEIANRLTVPVEPLLPFVGKPLRDLYQGAICGGVVFELTAGSKRVLVEVPMAFQSAMAGVMLAGEIVKRAATANSPDWITAKLNLLRKMPSGLITERRKKDHLARCICQDSDYMEVYREKYTSRGGPASQGS